jgi:hypothetical protein
MVIDQNDLSKDDDDTEITSDTNVETTDDQDDSHNVKECIVTRRFQYQEACLKCLRILRNKLHPLRLSGVSRLYKVIIIIYHFKLVNYSFYNCRVTLHAMVVVKMTS